MPQQYPIATPIPWLTSVVSHELLSREYADRHVYQLDDRPGFFRRVPSKARRTMEVANEGAVMACVQKDGKPPQFVEVVPFQELIDVMSQMRDRAEPPRDEEVPTCPAEGAATKGTAMDNLPPVTTPADDAPPWDVEDGEKDDEPPY